MEFINREEKKSYKSLSKDNRFSLYKNQFLDEEKKTPQYQVWSSWGCVYHTWILN